MAEAGSYGLPATSQVYVCGVPIEQAGAAQTTAPQIAPEQRFWATPPRPMSYNHSDGLVINLAKPKLISYLSFDLPAFPHHAYLYYQDHWTHEWREFCTKDKQPIRIYIDGATPAMIGSAAAFQAKQHPSHYGAGHWLHYDLDLHPITTSRIKIMVNRAFGTRKGGPKDQYGNDAPYSLGLRNFDFGCRVRERNDVPRGPRDPDILTQRQTFTQSFDLFGSPVELKLRENRAADLLRGCPWKSEPMPVPYAVVNFYVDARDAAGDPQVIDRFHLKPMYSGPCMNLYYATEVPDADFTASDSPIVFPLLRTAGDCEPELGSAGMRFLDQISYLNISNQAVQWDPTRPWWIGMEIRPWWAYPGPSSPHVIFDSGDVQLVWDAGRFRLIYGDGVLVMPQIDFGCNERLRLFVSFDGEKLTFFMPEAGAALSVPTDMDGMSIRNLRFGAETGPSDAQVIRTGNYTLNAFVLKQEALAFTAGPGGLTLPEGARRFMDDPGTYLDKPAYRVDDDGSTDNALLRYLPRFVCGSANTHGFVGGPGDIYEDVVWTPVMRDYCLREGMIQFHPVRAKFFKFEFTNLSPEPYQTLMPVSREIKCFTAAATRTDDTPQLSTQIGQSATSAGLAANADAVMQVVRYADSPAISNPSSADVLPTEALTARDVGVQAELDAQGGGLYRFDAWQPGQSAPCYPETSKHIYQKTTVTHSKQCAYFVGLCDLTMYRVDYRADDDTDQYIDLFDDTRFLDSALNDPESPGWHWDGDRLITASIARPVTTTSERLASRKHVRGVQFASAQSSAVQLLPDPDFTAMSLTTHWKPVGDVISMEYSQDFNATLGQAVKVLRSSQITTWAQMRTAYGTWGGIPASQDGDLRPVWRTLEGVNEAVGYGGIALRTPVSLSASGRVHAAARVYADHTLDTPLLLQLLSPDGTVLAEAERVVAAGRVVEWTLEHTMVDYTATADTWADVMARHPSPTQPTYGDLRFATWADLSAMAGPSSRQVSVRVIQRGAGRDTWYADSIAVFEDPIKWEFSNDDGENWWPALGIRNDPRGVLVFPPSTNPDAGRALRWRVTGYRPGLHVDALDIRPWYAENSFGVPQREPGVSGGPNIQPTDHYPAIEDDPFFKQWRGPIPQDWYFHYRQLLLLDADRAAAEEVFRPDVFANAYAVLVGVQIIPPPSPYDDVYEDAYVDMYGTLKDEES